MSISSDVLLVALCVLAYVGYRFAIKQPRLDSVAIGRANANSRFGANRERYIDRLSDCHWGPHVKRVCQLDSEDQEQLLCGVLRWFDETTTMAPDINVVLGRIRCEHGRLIDILYYVSRRALKEKLTPEQLHELDPNIVYKWLLQFR